MVAAETLESEVMEIILEILKSRRRGYRPDFTVTYTTPELKDAIRAQQKIGWDNFVLGRWSPLWQTVQAKYVSSFGSKPFPRQWAIAVIEKLVMITWDMWQF